MTAERSTERPVSGPMCYAISEYVSRQDGEVRTEYLVEDGTTVIASGISDRDIAEDIANLPMLRQLVQNGLAARLVPVQRSEHDLQVATLQLLEEILAELKRGNAAERTGSISSVQIEDYPTKDRPVRVTSKVYAGSVLPVDEVMADHARLHREAEAAALAGWAETIAQGNAR